MSRIVLLLQLFRLPYFVLLAMYVEERCKSVIIMIVEFVKNIFIIAVGYINNSVVSHGYQSILLLLALYTGWYTDVPLVKLTCIHVYL